MMCAPFCLRLKDPAEADGGAQMTVRCVMQTNTTNITPVTLGVAFAGAKNEQNNGKVENV